MPPPFLHPQSLRNRPPLDGVVRAQRAVRADLAEAERMITTEKVVALIGAYYSSVTTTASIAAERHKIPFLNPESTDPNLTERGFRYFFRTTPFDDLFAENFFQFLNDVKKRKGVKIASVATVYENTNFGTGANNAIRKNAAKSPICVLRPRPSRRGPST